MFELVNTSAENGLVALSHGFTTVAMTRGMDENMRVRLEAFCAYQHRTNAHDESFYRENPVNWFHVVEAHVGHILGRVAPCEFDYTGRTNRLAKLWVLAEGEWPRGKSAADILRAKRTWFAEAWAGEARYLEEDADAARGLTQCEGTTSLARWREVFGTRGEELARRVAWQVEKNLVGDRRGIFFKTAPAWDANGEKLLDLFAEVICLLPDELRGRVTFATYPAAMPNEVECVLRGSLGEDESFVRMEGSQAWIDCVAARVVHEEMLPTARSDWSTLLAETRKENDDLKEMLRSLQEANAVLDKECQRVKSAHQKLEEEHAQLRREHEKLKCTLLMCTSKLQAPSNAEGPNEGGGEKVPPAPPPLKIMQLEKAPRTKVQADTGLKLIMAAGLLIVSLIVLGIVLMKYSEELSLLNHAPTSTMEGSK